MDSGARALTRPVSHNKMVDEAGSIGHDEIMLIYKIFRASEWADLEKNGTTKGAPIDVADGYVHFSTAAQATETAAKHFAGEDDLWLITCSTDNLGPALKWEVSRGGADFPHLYRELSLDDVKHHQRLPLVDGVHVFPSEME